MNYVKPNLVSDSNSELAVFFNNPHHMNHPPESLHIMIFMLKPALITHSGFTIVFPWIIDKLFNLTNLDELTQFYSNDILQTTYCWIENSTKPTSSQVYNSLQNNNNLGVDSRICQHQFQSSR